jgi:hypothetical protein
MIAPTLLLVAGQVPWHNIYFKLRCLAHAGAAYELLQEAASAVQGHKFALHFLVTEWEQVVDAWQLDGWEAYLVVSGVDPVSEFLDDFVPGDHARRRVRA